MNEVKRELPYTYDCYVQMLLSREIGEDGSIEHLRRMVSENREKDSFVSGKEIKLFSARKYHKRIIEEAVADSYDLAVELGIENPAVAVATAYKISSGRVSQILSSRKEK
jgi:hypothetical protein